MAPNDHTLLVTFSRDRPIYRPGDQVTGLVRATIREQITAHSIIAKLKGEAETKIERKRLNDEGEWEKVEHKSDHTIVKNQVRKYDSYGRLHSCTVDAQLVAVTYGLQSIVALPHTYTVPRSKPGLSPNIYHASPSGGAPGH
jgi:hypothetical protein